MEHPTITRHDTPRRLKEPFSLNAFQIKAIAVLAMLIDHIAWQYAAMESAPGQLMHFVGRTTAPVMCFFLTEGYHKTKDLRKYFMRLGVFALISHFAFVYFETGKLLAPCCSSIISGLLLSLLCIHVWQCAPPENAALNRDIHFGFPLHPAFRLPVIGLLAYAATKCDWGIYSVLFTMTFELARRYGQKAQAKAYLLAALCYVCSKWQLPAFSIPQVTGMLFVLGIFLPVPLILLYNGKRGGGKFAPQLKWFFYVFYPAHMVILGILKYMVFV